MVEPTQITTGCTLCWHDPDDGKCSKTFTVKSVVYYEDSDILDIETTDGDELQCFAEELELISPDEANH